MVAPWLLTGIIAFAVILMAIDIAFGVTFMAIENRLFWFTLIIGASIIFGFWLMFIGM